MGDVKFTFQSAKLSDDSRILVVMCFQCKTEIASSIVLNMPLYDKCLPKNTVTMDFPSNKTSS